MSDFSRTATAKQCVMRVCETLVIGKQDEITTLSRPVENIIEVERCAQVPTKPHSLFSCA